MDEMWLLREAYRRLHDDPVLSYRAKLTERVVRTLRTGDLKSGPPPGVENDRVIAAIALVIASIGLPGSSE